MIQWDYGTYQNKLVQGKGHKSESINCVALVGDDIVSTSLNGECRFTPTKDFTYQGDGLKTTGTPVDITASTSSDLIILATDKGLQMIKGKQIVHFEQTKFEPTCLSLSPNNSFLAVGAADKKIRIYSVDDKLKEKKILDDHTGRLNSIKFSPDGKFLASGDSTKEIIVWETETWGPKYTGLTFHAAGVSDMSWSPDSTLLVSGSIDKSLIVWDLANGKRAVQNTAHLMGVKSVCFLDEKTVLSAGGDFRIISWNFSFDKK